MGLVLADPAPVLAPQAGVARALPATLLPALTKMTKAQASPEELKVVAAARARLEESRHTGALPWQRDRQGFAPKATLDGRVL